MTLNYEATLVVGHVAAVGAVMATYFRLHWKFMKKMAMLAEIITIFSMEHELLVRHLTNPTQAVNPDDWPTRKNLLLDKLREFQR